MRDWVLRKKQQGHHTLYCEGYHPIVADVYGPDATAHLIATAPDLLAALESIISLDLCCATREEQQKALPIFTAARAAVAKAKGEK